MVTKGIITSIDFNGNTCQVRIPLFETAGNDPITGTAIVSNTPGSYNGYKVGDVVLVAFEDGKMQNPVIVGKLYLGAAKEKQDPRGTINVETTTASKSASLPADAILTANVDSNVPNTNTPFGSLASIANNLNSLNTDVNQLDRFTRNQFNSVITDVNDQGEQLRSEIKQTAKNIEAAVVHRHQDGSQEGLGWDLTTDSWKINAQDTVDGKVKDINIVTIDRNGMSIAGDLKLNGYPKNITVLYAQNDSDTDYPYLYDFITVPFPSTPIDKPWYYGKYIKIEEKYVLIFKENFEDYSITVGTTKAYNREINSEWKTETPARVDGKYIWQWTHTEIYLFDGAKWIEQDDDKIVCITGAKGDTGAGVSECVTYYSLSNMSDGPKANDDNIASPPEIPKVNNWSTSPQAFDKTKHQGYTYWTVERRVYTDPAKIVWGTPVKASMLSVDFIDSLGITTKKITVRQDNANDKSAILFEADGLSNEGTVKIGGFDVKDNILAATDAISTNSVQIMPDKISMQATKSAYWLKNTKTVAEAKATYSYTYLFKRLGTKDSNATSNDGYSWTDFSNEYPESEYDYNIYSGDSPENNLVVVPFVDIYNKVTKDVKATFYYSYSHAGTPYRNRINGHPLFFELWIEKPEEADKEPRRLLVKNGTTVINDGNYEYPITDFIEKNTTDSWNTVTNNDPTYSSYTYNNYTTYGHIHTSSSPFKGVEYSYLTLKITKDIPTTFNIYLGISSNFNITQNFDTVIALEPTNTNKAVNDSPDFEFDTENGYTFKDTANYVLKASTSGNYVSGSLEDLVKVTYPSITLDSRKDPNTNEVIKDPKYIYILYVNRNNTQSTPAIDSGTRTTSIATAGFCVVPNLITYSDSKLSIGPNFNVTPNGQLTAKNAIFEDNMTVIGGGKLGAFELNNNSLANSAATWDHNGISLKDYKYLSIGNTEQFRLFKSRIDKSYVNFGESTTTTSTDTTAASTNTNEMVDVSYLQSYYPIIIQKLLPSTATPSGQSATSTLPGASILLTANESTITQYFHITAEVKSTKPIVESGGPPGMAIMDEFGNTGVVTGKRYNIDFKVTIVDKAGTPVKDEAGAAKKDYNFKFSAMFSVNGSTVAKTVSVRVPKGHLTATTNYSWPIRGTRTNFMGIKNIGGSTIKETLTLTETFIDSVVGSSTIQLSSGHIYLNGDTDLNGTTNLNGTTYLNGTKLEGSDRNLKENIKYLDSHADYLNVFNYLKPVEFNYKNNNLTQFGFIAQDILEALPLLNETKQYSLAVKNNDYYAVDYNSIIALNTLQIKYLTNKLSQLETAYNELLKKVEDK